MPQNIPQNHSVFNKKSAITDTTARAQVKDITDALGPHTDRTILPHSQSILDWLMPNAKSQKQLGGDREQKTKKKNPPGFPLKHLLNRKCIFQPHLCDLKLSNSTSFTGSEFSRGNGVVFPRIKRMVSFQIKLFLTIPAKPSLAAFYAKRELNQHQRTNAEQNTNFSRRRDLVVMPEEVGRAGEGGKEIIPLLPHAKP